MGSQKLSRATLIRPWVHAFEEDTDAGTVYRPEGAPLPPARGRDGFALRDDGTMSYLGIGRDDRSTSTEGRWVLDQASRRLSFVFPDGTGQVFTVVSATKQKLTLKP